MPWCCHRWWAGCCPAWLLARTGEYEKSCMISKAGHILALQLTGVWTPMVCLNSLCLSFLKRAMAINTFDFTEFSWGWKSKACEGVRIVSKARKHFVFPPFCHSIYCLQWILSSSSLPLTFWHRSRHPLRTQLSLSCPSNLTPLRFQTPDFRIHLDFQDFGRISCKPLAILSPTTGCHFPLVIPTDDIPQASSLVSGWYHDHFYVSPWLGYCASLLKHTWIQVLWCLCMCLTFTSSGL
jgi:hypothetical protein